MIGDDWQPSGVMVLGRDPFDLEQRGLRLLVNLCRDHGMTDRVTITRAWNRVRAEPALNQKRQGDTTPTAAKAA